MSRLKFSVLNLHLPIRARLIYMIKWLHYRSDGEILTLKTSQSLRIFSFIRI
jgi:hypothetical protein